MDRLAVGFVGVGFGTGLRVRRGEMGVCERRGRARGRMVGMGAAADRELGTVLVVLELEALEKVDDPLEEFFLRVDTHRKAKQKCYLAMATEKDHPEAMEHLRDAQYPNSIINCLVTRSGMDLFQSGYQTPDPYYAELSMKAWDAKPTQWVISEYFSDKLQPDEQEADLKNNEPGVMLNFAVKQEFQEKAVAVKEEVLSKLQEMGLRSRVIVDPKNSQLQILPMNASLMEAVKFIQQMLMVQESNTIIFGNKSSSLITETITRPNQSLLVLSDVANPDRSDPRIYETSSSGGEALLEGIIHHAIL